MAEAPTFGLVLDCGNPEALAAFWARALGYVTLGAAGNYLALVPDGRPGPKLLLQRVPEAKAAKNRMHLDIYAPDIEGTAKTLEELGASRIETGAQAEHSCHWIVMADPEGNEFCVCDAGANSSAC
jgi:predicted enzyme related to lactoylglutathione lyase